MVITSVLILDPVFHAAATSDLLKRFASRGPGLPWPLTLRRGSRQAARERERFSRSLSRQPCQDRGAQNKESTLKNITTCYDVGLMRINWCGKVSNKATNVTVLVETGENRVSAANWRLTKTEWKKLMQMRWKLFLCFCSTFMTQVEILKGKRRLLPSESRACRCAGRLHLGLVFAVRLSWPPITFSFHSFRRCGSIYIVASAVHESARHAVDQLGSWNMKGKMNKTVNKNYDNLLILPL